MGLFYIKDTHKRTPNLWKYIFVTNTECHHQCTCCKVLLAASLGSLLLLHIGQVVQPAAGAATSVSLHAALRWILVRRVHVFHIPQGSSREILRLLVPKIIPLMVFGSRDLNNIGCLDPLGSMCEEPCSRKAPTGRDRQGFCSIRVFKHGVYGTRMETSPQGFK